MYVEKQEINYSNHKIVPVSSDEFYV